MKSLKRVMLPIVFWCVCLLCACGEKKPEEAAPTATPAPTVTPTPLRSIKNMIMRRGNLRLLFPMKQKNRQKKRGIWNLQIRTGNGQ